MLENKVVNDHNAKTDLEATRFSNPPSTSSNKNLTFSSPSKTSGIHLATHPIHSLNTRSSSSQLPIAINGQHHSKSAEHDSGSTTNSKKSFSGEIFPGRRHSVGRAVDAFINVSNFSRLSVPQWNNAQFRRASLQVDSYANSLNSGKIISSCFANSRRSSPTALGRGCKRAAKDIHEATSEKRKLSCNPCSSYCSHYVSRNFNNRDAIFDIGADYMKVSWKNIIFI